MPRSRNASSRYQLGVSKPGKKRAPERLLKQCDNPQSAFESNRRPAGVDLKSQADAFARGQVMHCENTRTSFKVKTDAQEGASAAPATLAARNRQRRQERATPGSSSAPERAPVVAACLTSCGVGFNEEGASGPSMHLGRSGVMLLPTTSPDPETGHVTGQEMDHASQSSTQSNEGRLGSYEKYFQTSFSCPDTQNEAGGALGSAVREVPTSPAADSTVAPSTGLGRNRLDEADEADEADEDGSDSASGHVHLTLGTLSPPPHLSGPDESDDLLLEPSPQKSPEKTVHPPPPPIPPPPPLLPETPTPQNNPFARQNWSQLLPPSQLFGGTQFSSAIRRPSPTSSRPSPSEFPQNNTSPNYLISSPSKFAVLRSSPLGPVAVSSPTVILPGTNSSRFVDGSTTPADTASGKPQVVSQSPRSSNTRPWKSAPVPMSAYEPMHKSQERRSASVIRSHSDSTNGDSDDIDEDDVAMQRKMRAKSRKKSALKNMTEMALEKLPSVPAPVAENVKAAPAPVAALDDVEVPSTTQKGDMNSPEDYIAQCHGHRDESEESQNTVEDSQVQRPRDPLSAASALNLDNESTPLAMDEEPEATLSPEPEQLPDTAVADPNDQTEQDLLEGDPNPAADVVPETSPSATKTPAFHSSPPPPYSTLPKAGDSGSESPLSDLGMTPNTPRELHEKPAPLSGDTSKESDVVVAASAPRPVVRNKQKRADARKSLPLLKTVASIDSFRSSARLSRSRARRRSISIDELSASPSAIAFEHSLLKTSAQTPSVAAPPRSKLGQVVRAADERAPKAKLFLGMAFAISFQGKRPGESEAKHQARATEADSLSERVRQAGGRVLSDGFDELFQPIRPSSIASSRFAARNTSITPVSSPVDIPASNPDDIDADPEDILLNAAGKAVRFAALLADGHSRKVKYMQALALGLPCVAARWVDSCLERGEVVDWAPYLLCAGQSAFLGDAIRSRNLPPYDAATSRLLDVVSRRDRFLRGSRVLIVLKKGQGSSVKAIEAKKGPYVFLARLLGAALYRVTGGPDEARAELQAAEAAGRPFDWVYMDGKPEAGLYRPAADATGKPKKPAGGAKRAKALKRKRSSTIDEAGEEAETGADGPPAAKRVRTLSDELVIQSLILGRLLDEREMGH